MIVAVSFILYMILSIVIIIFQLCLAFGVPWGSASMGGKYPGSYPKDKRIIPLISMAVLILLAFIIMIRAGFIFQNLFTLSKGLIWIVVTYYGIGVVLNTITPSKIERVWAPVSLLQFICALMIALD